MLLILAATLLLAVAGSHGFAGYQRLRKIDPANIDPSLMTVLIPVMLNREYFHDPQTLKDITGDYVPTGPLKGMTSTNAKRKFKNRLLNKRHYKNKRGFYISDEPQSYHRPYRSSSLYRSLNTERFKLERPYEEEDEYERRPRETLRYRYRNNYNTGPVDHYVYDKRSLYEGGYNSDQPLKARSINQEEPYEEDEEYSRRPKQIQRYRSLNEDAYNADQPLKASGINQEEPYEEDEEYSRRPKQIQRYRSLDEGDYNTDQPLKARRINEEEPYEEDEEYSRPKQTQRYRTLYQDGYNSDQALKARRINTGYPFEEEEEDERPREIQRYRYRTNYLTGHGHHYAYHKRFREY